MNRIFIFSIIILTIFTTCMFFLVSHHTSVLPNFISSPVRYLISKKFVQDIRKIKNYYRSPYSVGNDFSYDDLPKDDLTLDYYLDWSYHSNDTFYVERVLLSNDSVEKKYYFTKEYLYEMLYDSAYGQDENKISYKPNQNVRPKHFLFNEFG